MRIDRLTLRAFRNYRDITITFPSGGAYITGANGSGKTNMLEAMYFLANQMSFRTTKREELPSWGSSQCLIAATITSQEDERQSELAIQLSPHGRRLLINGKATRDLQKFASYFAAVAFHPGTLNVIKGGPGGRRTLVDRGIASLQPGFLQTSQEHQRLLKQRNALLRTPTPEQRATLAVWTERFIDVAVQITRARQAHVLRLNTILSALGESLGVEVGTLALTYHPAALAHCSAAERTALLSIQTDESLLRERFLSEAQRLQRAEMAVGQTLFGPQRDDIAIAYRARETRSYASQGQQRLSAFLLVAALALAIERQHGHRPVVLLDDVVSELDEHNRRVIFGFLQAHAFQVFITDVEERLLYRHLDAFSSFHVCQTNGHAELHESPAAQRVLCDLC
ncbi:MAG: DNA replication/repair protein RecF [Candidatus Tectimicrobiota bacterium]